MKTHAQCFTHFMVEEKTLWLIFQMRLGLDSWTHWMPYISDMRNSEECGLHEILAQIRGENSSVIPSLWARLASPERPPHPQANYRRRRRPAHVRSFRHARRAEGALEAGEGAE
jgi:hypothetical protein